LINLGVSAKQSQASLVATLPLAQRLQALGTAGAPSSANLRKLTESLQSTGGIQQLMKLLFNGAVAGNGFDSLSHYVRDEPLVSTCTNYVTTAVPGCSANFVAGKAASASAASVRSAGSTAPATAVAADTPIVTQAVRTATAKQQSVATMKGLLGYLMGTGS